MSIKLIIFDAYGVSVKGGYPDTCKFLAKKFNRDYNQIYKILYIKYTNLAALRKISQQEAWDLAIKELKLPISVLEIKKIHYSFLKPNLQMFNLAKKLSSRYKIILLTKNTRSQLSDVMSFIPQLGEIFGKKNIFNTWEYNLPKASKKTMDFVFNRFKVKSNEVLYIDDQNENLEEAKKMGVNTIFYTTFSKVKNNLEEILN